MTSKTTKRTAKPTASAKLAKKAKKVRDRTVVKADQPALAEPISDAGLIEILNLSKGANSIEMKLSVPASSHRATTKGIGFDPVEAQPRQAFFFDTPTWP